MNKRIILIMFLLTLTIGMCITPAFAMIYRGEYDGGCEIDPVKIYHDGNDKVFSGYANESQFQFSVNVVWENIPQNGKWVTVEMQEKSDFGITFSSTTFNLTKTGVNKSVLVTVPILGLEPKDKYHIHLQPETTAQDPSNPHVAGTESTNLWFEILEEPIPPPPPQQYSLTITVQGNGSTNPAVGVYLYEDGQIATTTAISDFGSYFDGWLLDANFVSNTTNPISIEMCDPQEPCSNHTLIAVFNLIPLPQKYELVISATTCDGSQLPLGCITDPIMGTYLYEAGQIATTTAIASNGWFFDRWLLDGISKTQNPISIEMCDPTIPCSNHTLTAIFNPIPIPPTYYTLTVTTIACDGTPNGYGTATHLGVHSFLEGTIVHVTATANEGWFLQNWNYDGHLIDASTTVTVTMNKNHALQAIFNPIPPPPPKYYTLTITMSACDGTPSGYGTTEPIGIHTYLEGTEVTVTATASQGWFLQNWVYDGNSASNSVTYKVVMDSNHNLEAIFNPNPLPPETNTVTVYVSFCGDVMQDTRAYTTITYTGTAPTTITVKVNKAVYEEVLQYFGTDTFTAPYRNTVYSIFWYDSIYGRRWTTHEHSLTIRIIEVDVPSIKVVLTT